ncbi:hypothetical protein QEN19_003560 [Hanseniaspora menglaensis]
MPENKKVRRGKDEIEISTDNSSIPIASETSTISQKSINKTLLSSKARTILTQSQKGSTSRLSDNTTLFTETSAYTDINSEKIGQLKHLPALKEIVFEEETEEEYERNVFGKPLRVTSVLPGEEYNAQGIDLQTISTQTLNTKNSLESSSSNHSSNLFAQNNTQNIRKTVLVLQKLSVLCDNLSIVVDDIHQSVKSISKASMSFIDILKDFLVLNGQKKLEGIELKNNIHVTRIFKMVLHLCDNFLSTEVYQTTKAILLTKFLQFCQIFDFKIYSESDFISNEDVRITLPFLQLFPVTKKSDQIEKIMNGIISSSGVDFISESEGAFIAPVFRGLTSECSILSVIFGVPEENSSKQLDIISSLYSLFPDIHFYCVKNYITPCNINGFVPKNASLNNNDSNSNVLLAPTNTVVNLPYRVPEEYANPQISLSISTLNKKTKMSGTLGGFIQPIINEASPKSLKHYANSNYGITCAHVILSESQDYPQVAVPSVILQERYKKNIKLAQEQYNKDSQQFNIFDSEIQKIEDFVDKQFLKPFGQVIWGERCILSNNKLSDFAIVKLNDSITLEKGNYLGDDVIASIGDPSLRFENGYIRNHLHIDELVPGIEIFKYGSSTKFTKGFLNGHKMVYWSDGKLQSSEFVVNSLDNNPLFATGGDSGSFVLTKDKLKVGLSVVGMLHSYDGELKQLGLFTPMHTILERLKAVTNVDWEIKKPSL